MSAEMDGGLDGLITKYFLEDYKYDEILSFLEKDGFEISLATLRRKLAKLGLKRINIHKPGIDESIKKYFYKNYTYKNIVLCLEKDGFKISRCTLLRKLQKLGLKRGWAGLNGPGPVAKRPEAFCSCGADLRNKQVEKSKRKKALYSLDDLGLE